MEKKERWNSGRIYKTEKGAVGGLTMFVNSENMTDATINRNGVSEEVGRILCSGKYSKGCGIEYAFGPEYVSDKKYTNFSVTLGQYAKEAFQKLDVKKGDIIRCHGFFTANSYEKDGETRYSLNLLCDAIEPEFLISKRNNSGEAPRTAPAKAQAPAPVQSEEVSVDDAFGDFENSFDIMEDDIQF